MLTFTTAQLYGWLAAFLWPFVRILALIATAPLLGDNSVPKKLKIGLALVISIAIAPILPAVPDISPISPDGLWILIQQVLIGTALGFSMRLVFAAVQAAGEFIGLQMGLAFATFYDPASRANTAVLGGLLYICAMLVFVAIDGHLLTLAVLLDSFIYLPISATPIAAHGFATLAASGGMIFSSGLTLALPLIAALLTTNLALGMLNRSAPQLSIFSVGFPLIFASGLLMLNLVLPDLAPYFNGLFAAGFDNAERIARAMIP